MEGIFDSALKEGKLVVLSYRTEDKTPKMGVYTPVSLEKDTFIFENTSGKHIKIEGSELQSMLKVNKWE